MTRSVAEAKAISMGWTIGSVSKNLTVLVSNDPDSSSGKMKKAKSLGIKIMTEKEFFRV
jgi:DNA ligase (NAD+)